jgi:DNA polymerase III subunit delta'
MEFAPFPWHRPWLSHAHDLVSSHHHAWLVVGRAGDGAGQAAAALAALLLCLSPKDHAACGECPSCRWLAGDVHPDFRRLLPDTGDGETVKLPTIKIDVVREALDFMQLSAAGSRGRVLLVDPASALARESANALLKALEEPPPNTRWLLVTSQAERLLPTIRSRALRLPLPRPSQDDARAWMRAQGANTVDVDALLLRTRGEPLTAQALAGSGLAAAHDAFVRDLLRPGQFPTLHWGGWVESGGKLEKRERFANLLQWLADWTSDWSRVRANLLPSVYRDQSEALNQLALRLPLAEALRYHRALLRKRYLPDTTLSARLQCESLLLDYRALFSR